MIKRKVFNIYDLDKDVLTINPGDIVSISPYHAHPTALNPIEMFALGIFTEKYIQGRQVRMVTKYTKNYEDVFYLGSSGDLVVIRRDDADDPSASYAVIPYRVANSIDGASFAKNFVIVSKPEGAPMYIPADAVNVGASPRFIPIRAESLIEDNLRFALNNL